MIAGANIALTDSATGATKTTTSGETGLYEIAGLNAGNYNMTVTAKGFQTFVQNGIVVNVSATFRVDPKLTVGAESTTVTVQADALTVQSDSNVVSTLDQRTADYGTRDERAQHRRSCDAGPGSERQPARLEHTDLGGIELHDQLQRSEPGSQHLADRRRRSI